MEITKLSYTIKVEYNKEIRKIPAISNFEELNSSVISLFNFKTGFVKFQYKDDDNELITISNDDDMICMFD